MHFLLCYHHVSTQGNDRLDTFAPNWVGNADHRDFIDRRVLEQDLLYFPWIDIIAAANDHIFLTVEQVEVALCIHHTDIAGMQPSSPQGLSRCLRPGPVPCHDNASSCDNFSNLPICHLVIVVIDDAHLHIGARNPCRSEASFRKRVAMRHMLFSPQVGDRHGCFALAINLNEHGPKSFHCLLHVLTIHRSSTVRDTAQTAQVVGLVRPVEQHFDLGRGKKRDSRHTQVLDQGKDRLGIETGRVQNNAGCTLCNRWQSK